MASNEHQVYNGFYWNVYGVYWKLLAVLYPGLKISWSTYQPDLGHTQKRNTYIHIQCFLSDANSIQWTSNVQWVPLECVWSLVEATGCAAVKMLMVRCMWQGAGSDWDLRVPNSMGNYWFTLGLRSLSDSIDTYNRLRWHWVETNGIRWCFQLRVYYWKMMVKTYHIHIYYLSIWNITQCPNINNHFKYVLESVSTCRWFARLHMVTSLWVWYHNYYIMM